jgi:5-methylthioadenosine/S-adenosylhomocysteine deaminase
LDLFGEMDCCAKLHKAATLDPTALPANTVLKMATRNGAHALGMGDRIGVLTPEARADCIIVDFRKPHLTPVYEPISHLVYAVGGGDVIHSVIEGRLVMENRHLLTLDLDEVMDRVLNLSRIIQS